MSSLPTSYSATGEYYAYVTQALDIHRIAVTAATDSATQDDVKFLSLDKQLHCSLLDWCGSDLVAIGLTNGHIYLYAHRANEIAAKLITDANSIRSVHCIGNTLYAADEQRIYQWDLTSYKLVKAVPFAGIYKLSSAQRDGEMCLLAASHKIQLLDLEFNQVTEFPGHVSPVIFVSAYEGCIVSAAENDRFVNIYDLATGATKAVLVAQANVCHVALSASVIALVTEDGVVEVFNEPLASSNKRRGLSKNSTTVVTLKRPSEALLAILSAYIKEDVLNITWNENANVPYFAAVMWESDSTVVRAQPVKQAVDHSLHGHDAAANKLYTEGNATVTAGDNLKYLDVDSDSETLADRLASVSVKPKTKTGRATTGTLAVVLTQALKANDSTLLETVLSNRDTKVIQATIQRLDSSLAVVLLDRLAERIARQTHRQGQLNVWVKWTLVAHGGYLINLPNLMSSLSSLHSTLVRRSATLPRLQLLESKLDSVLQQVEFKREYLASRGVDLDVGEDDEDEVEYIEELEDAELIEDGEMDASDSEDEQMQEDDEEHEDVSESDNEEVGYSDEEVQ